MCAGIVRIPVLYLDDFGVRPDGGWATPQPVSHVDTDPGRHAGVRCHHTTLRRDFSGPGEPAGKPGRAGDTLSPDVLGALAPVTRRGRNAPGHAIAKWV